MSAYILRLIHWTGPLWSRFGADPAQLSAILEAKLKMDGRRTHFLAQYRNQQYPGFSGAMALTISFLFLFGLIMSFAFFVFEESSTGLFLYLTVWMVLLTMSLITDFTDVLIDSRDNFILLPRPVNGPTLTLARLLHISIYLLKLSFSFALPGLVAFPIHAGIAGFPMLALQLLLSIIMVVVLINFFYLFLIRLANPVKIKDVLGYFQIAASVFLVIGIYLGPRLIGFGGLASLSIYDQSLFVLFPSAWIASLWDTLILGDIRLQAIFFSLLALSMPVVALFLIVRLFAPYLQKKLFRLSLEQSDQGAEGVREGRSGWKQRYFRWWFSRFQDPEERAAFALAWNLTGRDRDYLVRVAPQFGLMVGIMTTFAILGEGSLRDRWDSFLRSELYLVFLYFSFFLGFALLQFVFFTKRSDRAWILFATPVEYPGRLMLGAMEAVLIRYFLPYFLGLSVLILLLFGGEKIPAVLFSFFALLLALLGSISVQLRFIPFSRPIEEARDNVGSAIIGGFLTAFLGGIHYGITLIPWLYVVVIPAVVFGCSEAVKGFRKMGWEMVSKG